MTKPTILVIGESSTLNYLTFVFSSLQWRVITSNNDETKLLLRSISIDIDNKSYQYHVDNVINYFDKLRLVYDLVVLTSKFYYFLIRKPQAFKNIIHDKSIILLDGWDCPWLFTDLDLLLPNNIVLGLYSNIDCRRISSNPNGFKLLSSNNITLMIGVLCQSNKPDLPLVLNYQNQGIMFKDLAKFFKSNNHGFLLFPSQTYLYITKSIWKNLLTIVSLHTLSIIFEEYDVFKLTQNSSITPLLQGTFNEILSICNEKNLKFLPKENSSDSRKLLQIMILSEANAHLKLKTTLSMNINFLDANPSYYNFINGFELGLNRLFKGLLTLSLELEVKTPYLESVNGFLQTLVNIRNTNYSKMFHLKKSLLNFNTVNGITPDKNMMNFPPFNPLPCPTPPTQFNANPLIMMVQKKGDNDRDSVVSIDSGVKEAYNETFYADAVETPTVNVNNLSPQAPNPLPQISNQLLNPENSREFLQTTSPQFMSAPNLPYYTLPMIQQPNYSYVPQQHPLNYPQPYPPQAYLSQIHPPPFAMPSNQIDTGKTKTFRHLQPNLTNNTTTRQLLQYHSEFLASIRFDEAMDHLVPSRYGKHDTSTVKINSASHSTTKSDDSHKTSH